MIEITAQDRAELRWAIEEHRCPKCDLVKPSIEFYRYPDGRFSGYCKRCDHARRLKYENTRRARKVQAFVEVVDPAVVAKRDRLRCHICKRKIGGTFHLDHVVPLSKGGAHSYSNVKLAHPHCNVQKGAAMPALD